MRAVHAPGVVAVLAALAVFGGCGGGVSGGDEAAAEAAVVSYVGALRAGDSEAVCALLTQAELDELDAAGSCAEVMGRGLALAGEQGVEIPEYEVSEVTVDGDSAQARLRSGSTDLVIPLAREDGEWKLTGTTSFGQLHPDEPLPR